MRRAKRAATKAASVFFRNDHPEERSRPFARNLARNAAILFWAGQNGPLRTEMRRTRPFRGARADSRELRAVRGHSRLFADKCAASRILRYSRCYSRPYSGGLRDRSHRIRRRRDERAADRRAATRATDRREP